MTRLKVAIRPTIDLCGPRGRGLVIHYLKATRTARAFAIIYERLADQNAGWEFVDP
jgi:hypothetical protein